MLARLAGAAGLGVGTLFACKDGAVESLRAWLDVLLWFVLVGDSVRGKGVRAVVKVTS